MDYTILSTGPTTENGRPSEPGHINGGMFARQGPIADHKGPVVTVVVDDVDAALADVAANGGRQFGDAFDVPGMGKAAYFTDTEGNVMGSGNLLFAWSGPPDTKRIEGVAVDLFDPLGTIRKVVTNACDSTIVRNDSTSVAMDQTPN